MPLYKMISPTFLCLCLTVFLRISYALLPLQNGDNPAVPKDIDVDHLPKPSPFLPPIVKIPPILGRLKQPGAYIQISRAGLNYAGNKAVEFLSRYLTSQNIPDKKDSTRVIGLKFNYQITNMKLYSFTKPSSSVIINPGAGITWSLRNAATKLSGNWKFDTKIIFRITRSGTFDLTASGASITLSLSIGKNGDGKPTISVRSCSCSISNFDIKFRGDLAWLLNIFSGLIERKVKSDLQEAICRAAEDVINKDAASQMSSFKTSVIVEEVYQLDYRLVRDPLFTSNYIQTAHKGEISYVGDKSPALLFGPTISISPPTKMMAVYLSEFVFNTLKYALYKNQFFILVLKKGNVPKKYEEFLSLNCPSKKCFGTLFSDAADQYPDSFVELLVRATEAPSFDITSQKISGKIKGTVEVTARHPNGTSTYLMRLNVTAVVNITAWIQANRVKGKIIDSSFTIAIDYSIISTPPQPILQQLINWVAESFGIPKFNEIGERGIEIPKVKDVEFVNPTLTLTDGAVVVSTDVSVTV